jgi:hypothetical protein
MKIHSLLAELNNMDVQCIFAGDWDGSDALGGQITRARDRRQHALEALREHLAEHKCEPKGR